MDRRPWHPYQAQPIYCYRLKCERKLEICTQHSPSTSELETPSLSLNTDLKYNKKSYMMSRGMKFGFEDLPIAIDVED